MNAISIAQTRYMHTNMYYRIDHVPHSTFYTLNGPCFTWLFFCSFMFHFKYADMFNYCDCRTETTRVWMCLYITFIGIKSGAQWIGLNKPLAMQINLVRFLIILIELLNQKLCGLNNSATHSTMNSVYLISANTFIMIVLKIQMPQFTFYAPNPLGNWALALYWPIVCYSLIKVYINMSCKENLVFHVSELIECLLLICYVALC